MEGSTNHDSAWLIATKPSNIGHTTYIFWHRYWMVLACLKNYWIHKRTIGSDKFWAIAIAIPQSFLQWFFMLPKHSVTHRPIGKQASLSRMSDSRERLIVTRHEGSDVGWERQQISSNQTQQPKHSDNWLPLYCHIVLYPFIIPGFCIVRFGQIGCFTCKSRYCFHRTVP